MSIKNINRNSLLEINNKNNFYLLLNEIIPKSIPKEYVEYFKSIRNNTIKKINSNGFIKNVFFDIANKGFRF